MSRKVPEPDFPDGRRIELTRQAVEDELGEWVGPLAELSGQAENVYAMFNNNGRSTMPALPTLENPAEEGSEVAQAPVNAEMLRQLLQREGLPVTPAPAAA